MNTLKKISLKSASVLDDKQLKQIYGGSGSGSGSDLADCSAPCGDGTRVSISCSGICDSIRNVGVYCYVKNKEGKEELVGSELCKPKTDSLP